MTKAAKAKSAAPPVVTLAAPPAGTSVGETVGETVGGMGAPVESPPVGVAEVAL